MMIDVPKLFRAFIEHAPIYFLTTIKTEFNV
jgi:hypothetical protein